MRFFHLLALAAGTVIAAAAPAAAAPKTAAQTVAENGVYFWVDGLYERVKLPTYGLGLHNVAGTAPFVDLGPMQTFNPRLDGGGVRAAIGYGIPGTSTRIEFGGSYFDASATQSQTTSPGATVAGQFLTGGNPVGGYNCVAGVAVCGASGVLNTDYRAWQFNGKAETDWKYGSMTVTPSLAVFGGNTRANQTSSQSFEQFVAGILFNDATYSANTQLEWRDLGARAGLHLNASVTPELTIGIGGSVGAAARRTSLTGNDFANFSTPVPLPRFVGSSALSLDDNKTVLLASAEANFTYQFNPMMSLRGFAGLNYDGDVPGIAAPSYAGSFAAPTSTSAASIIYASETSFYAGGGLLVKFGGGARP